MDCITIFNFTFMKNINILVLLILFFSSSFSTIIAQNKAVFLGDSSTWADSIMATLSEEERIAQLFIVAAYSNKGKDHKKEIANLVERYKIGGLMFLQGGPVRQAKLTNFFPSPHTNAVLIFFPFSVLIGIF